MKQSLMLILILCISSLGPVGVAQQPIEKKTLRIGISYYQQNDYLPTIKVSVKTKTGKKFEPVEGVPLNFFFQEESSQGFIGRVVSDQHGMASLPLTDRWKSDSTSNAVSKFIVTANGIDRYSDANSEIEIIKARIDLSLEREDTSNVIRARLLAFENNAWIPVSDTELKLVIKHTLSNLPASDEESYTTDENGEVAAPFTTKVPGDENGNIEVGALLEDHELFGTLLCVKKIDWGEKKVYSSGFAKRALWGARNRAPIWLLLVPNLIIAGVWGAIMYLLYLIIQIRKIGKSHV